MVTLESVSLRHAAANDQLRDARSVHNAPLNQPLVLDLDQTLLRSDLLVECFVAALRRNPFVLFQAIFWLARGKAFLKKKLAPYAPDDLDAIPAHDGVVELAEREARRGRRVVLATASDELMARRVAKRFAFIAEVFASDGTKNLKGASKAERLAERFPQGFIYAGDSKADLVVWARAQSAVGVNLQPKTAKALAQLGKPMLLLNDAKHPARVLIKAARVKQWAKNALIFIPLFLAGMATDIAAWRDALLAFFGLGFVASATYLLNDLFDLADDRRHWTKRSRPLASGALPIGEGLMLVPVLSVAGFALAAAAGWAVLATVTLYTVVTLAYSFHVKRVPILDVAVLATLFTLRLFLGVVAIGAVISPWLFVFSMALFLSLSTAKRHTEVVRMALHGKTKTAGRGYIARDEPMLLALGLAAAMSAVVLFSLYLTAEAFHAAMYTAPGFLWATPILLFLWLGRIWLVSQRGELDDDPVAFALKDKASLVLGLMLGLAFGGAIFGGLALGVLPWIA
jgi:4-hydroxybenzoate polyprenyltransferase/phosphoserine phosphatase